MKPEKRSPGPFSFAMFKASNGDDCPGIKCDKTGGAVAWAAGKDDAQAIANAQMIALALNAYMTREVQE